MALSWTTFGSFEDVEAHYNKTKPIRGKDNEGKDIRPIGDRRRKWERIVKVNKNCYALTDGFHFGDTAFPPFIHWGYNPNAADMGKYAPIVWRKRKDGTTTVTFRNGFGLSAHTSRYAFINRHTPWGFRFRISNGKQFITYNGTDYYLAKGLTAPKAVVEQIKTRSNGRLRNYYLKEMYGRISTRDDKASVTFVQTDTGWEFVGSPNEVPKPPKPPLRRIDKALKAEIKEGMESFYTWLKAVGPMVMQMQRVDIRNQVKQWAEDDTEKRRFRHVSLYGYTRYQCWFDAELLRGILCDEEHEMRVPAAWSALQYITDTEDDTESEARKRFNTWVNNNCDLYKIVERKDK